MDVAPHHEIVAVGTEKMDLRVFKSTEVLATARRTGGSTGAWTVVHTDRPDVETVCQSREDAWRAMTGIHQGLNPSTEDPAGDGYATLVPHGLCGDGCSCMVPKLP